MNTRTSENQVVIVLPDKLGLSEPLLRKGQSKTQTLDVIILMKILVNSVTIDLAADLNTGLSLKCQFYYSYLPVKKINGYLARQMNDKRKSLAYVLIWKN